MHGSLAKALLTTEVKLAKVRAIGCFGLAADAVIAFAVSTLNLFARQCARDGVYEVMGRRWQST